jgi:hypothetical protein
VEGVVLHHFRQKQTTEKIGQLDWAYKEADFFFFKMGHVRHKKSAFLSRFQNYKLTVPE